ncbi:MAG: hypothetical protein ACE5GD_08405 [Candidatus Geothermarchaeales archaeon]
MQTSKVKRKYVELVLVGMLVTTLVPVSIGYAQGNEDVFERIAGQAREKVDELIALIEEATGITWPGDFPSEITGPYGEAVSDFEAGQYKDAMIAFRKVFKELNIYVEAEGYTFERGVGVEAQGMFIAINRANETIDRIEDAYEGIESAPEPYATWVTANLSEARADLDEAKTALEQDPPDISIAESELESARDNISEAFVALKLIAEWKTSWRVESFLQGVKKRLLRARRLLERTGFDSELKADLDALEAKIGEARGAMPVIKDAIAILRSISEGLRDFHQEIAAKRRGGHSPLGKGPQGPPGG